MQTGTISFHNADGIRAEADAWKGHVWIKIDDGNGSAIALHFTRLSYAKASLVAMAINEAMSSAEPVPAPLSQAAE